MESEPILKIKVGNISHLCGSQVGGKITKCNKTLRSGHQIKIYCWNTLEVVPNL